jgi:hypothetical protein
MERFEFLTKETDLISLARPLPNPPSLQSTATSPLNLKSANLLGIENRSIVHSMLPSSNIKRMSPWTLAIGFSDCSAFGQVLLERLIQDGLYTALVALFAGFLIIFFYSL